MRVRLNVTPMFVLAVVVLTSVALVTAVVRAAAGQTRPSGPADAVPHAEAPATAAPGSCMQCHSSVSSHQLQHPKLADCASCHVQAPNQAHRFTDKSCTACHQMATPQDKFVHGPVAVGECLACHNPHGAEEPQLVRVFGPALCETCHVDTKAKLAEKRFTHDPVREDCATCHDPHASPAKYQLRDPSAEQCFGCHKTMRIELASSRVKHDAVRMDRGCINCHDPHAADMERQLKGTSMELCLTCHNQEHEGPDGKLQDIKGWLSINTDLHGPIRQQDCVGCHNPHAGKHFRLLKREYPEKFYAAFEAKRYDLCFMCHEPDLVKVETSTTVTGFRNGDVNLHFVHVNHPEKGRTCRACHEPHSSSSPKHMRESVPFGAWQLPIGFEPLQDGGTCTTGCHVTRAYNRTTPVIGTLTASNGQ